MSLEWLFKAHDLAERLRNDFKAVADLLGPEKAFYVFAGEVVTRGLDDETEEKFVAIIRTIYDDYLERATA